MMDRVLPFVWLLIVAAVCMAIGLLPRKEFWCFSAFCGCGALLGAFGTGVLPSAAWGLIAYLTTDIALQYLSRRRMPRGSVASGIVTASDEKGCVVQTAAGRYTAADMPAFCRSGEEVHVLITGKGRCDIIGPVL